MTHHHQAEPRPHPAPHRPRGDSELPTFAEGRRPDRALVASLTGILTDAVQFIRLSVDRVQAA